MFFFYLSSLLLFSHKVMGAERDSFSGAKLHVRTPTVHWHSFTYYITNMFLYWQQIVKKKSENFSTTQLTNRSQLAPIDIQVNGVCVDICTVSGSCAWSSYTYCTSVFEADHPWAQTKHLLLSCASIIEHLVGLFGPDGWCCHKVDK